ncbi:hypothetical protein ACEWY4_020036 [Coilia grayii]|uniref:GIY-YIG domain-containing protein n=1 Tax=Coilia grayii TaxID=363190 RepID=A0ABD1JBG1_9TELE
MCIIHTHHPVSLKKSLPISQFNRIRRLCSREEDFQTQAYDLEARFKDRHYTLEWITSARKRFEGMSQMECLYAPKRPNTEPRINCIVQFSPVSHEFQSIIQQYWHIIASDPSLTCFTSTPRVVFKRPPNLRNLLVRAHNPPQPEHFLHQIPQGNYKCGQCAQCNFTTKTKIFHHPLTGKPLHIKGVITCNTNNVIYMLRCPCGLAYIGKTTRSLKTRIAEHRSNIRNHNDKSPVAIHFTAASHNVSSLRYIGIEHVKSPSRGGDVNSLLLKREAYWIYTLGTLFPKGLNEDFDLRPFL